MQTNARIAIVHFQETERSPAVTTIEVAIGDKPITILSGPSTVSPEIREAAQHLIDLILKSEDHN